MSDAKRFTAQEKRVEAERELKYRQWVYSGKVSKGKMTQKDMDLKIALMTEIKEDYLELEQKGRLI